MNAIKPLPGLTLAVPSAVPTSVDEAVGEAAVLAAGLLVAGSRRLHPGGRWRCWREDQSEVDAAGGAGLDHRELVAAAEAQVALLRGDIEGAERAELAEEGIVRRPESSLAPM